MNNRPAARPLAFGAFYLAAHLAAELTRSSAGGLPFHGPWLALGLALGFIAVGGTWFALVALAANLATAWFVFPAEIGWLREFFPVVIVGAASAGAWALRRVMGDRLEITRLRELGIVVGAGVLAALLAAGFEAWGLGQVAPTVEAPRAGLFAALGVAQVLGVLLALPVILLWLAPLYWGRVIVPYGREDERGRWEIAAQAAAVIAALVFVRNSADLGLGCLVALVPILWVALRQGLHVSSLAVLVLVLAIRPKGPVDVPGWALQRNDAYVLILITLALGAGTIGTSHRRLLVALRQRQALLSGVLKGSCLGLWEWAPSGELRVDDQWLAMFGYRADEIAPQDQAWRKLVHAEDLAHVLWLRDAHWKGHAPLYEAEYRVLCKDGTYKWILDRGVVVARDEAGGPSRMAGTCLDLTSRKQAEAALLRVVGIMDQAADFVGAVDLQGNLFYANQALIRLRNDTDLASACRRHISEYYSEALAQKVLREGMPTALARGVWAGEIELSDVSGRSVPVSQIIVAHRDSEGTVQCFSFIARDITRAKRAEEAARTAQVREFRAQKYESLARLASGVAHDFNNLLTPILGNVGLASIDAAAGSPVGGYLQQIEVAAVRAAEVCQSLQLYAGKGRGNLRLTDLNELMRATEPELRRLAGPDLALELQLAAPLPRIAVDSAKIGHAFQLLVEHARENCVGRVGRLHVRTFVLEVGPDELAELFAAPEFRAGPHVVLEFADDGNTLNQATIERLLEPFFSTRPGFRGMGLAVLLGIGMAHAGAVSLCSEPARGNCVRLYFPLQDTFTPAPAPLPGQLEWRGAGQVLVIDDEQSVRSVATSLLESLGFAPLVARDGIEGLRIVRQHATSLRAVILDLTMPNMDGEQAYAEIRRVNAEVPIIVMSGFSEAEMEARFKTSDPAGFLQKPFTRDTLRAVMHEAIVGRV